MERRTCSDRFSGEISGKFVPNAVYSKSLDVVVVGVECMSINPRHFQLFGIHASNGSISWKSPVIKDMAPSTLTLSENNKLVYLSTGIQCSYMRKPTYISTQLALSLINGSVVWQNKTENYTGCGMVTKIGKLQASGMELLLMPDFAAGLTAYTLDQGKEVWHSQNVSVTSLVNLGISTRGFVYGSYGQWCGAFDPVIFGVNTTNGNVTFSNKGYCDGYCRYVTGPAVDAEGNAYYSCGNVVFSVNMNGSLRWKCKEFGYTENDILVSVSVHPKGYVFFIPFEDFKEIGIITLSTENGSLVHTYHAATTGQIYSPPILVGDSFMYIVACNIL